MYFLAAWGHYPYFQCNILVLCLNNDYLLKNNLQYIPGNEIKL